MILNLKESNMTEENIINGFIQMAQRERTNNKVFPNIHLGGFECDILELTKAGYLYEYEVKISKADFKADAKKKTWAGTKYELIKLGNRTNYFYYVVPEGLLSVEDVPEFAGLIWARKGEHGISIKGETIVNDRIYFDYKKAALKLSKEKASEKRILKLMESMYYRYHAIRQEVVGLRKKAYQN